MTSWFEEELHCRAHSGKSWSAHPFGDDPCQKKVLWGLRRGTCDGTLLSTSHPGGKCSERRTAGPLVGDANVNPTVQLFSSFLPRPKVLVLGCKNYDVMATPL